MEFSTYNLSGLLGGLQGLVLFGRRLTLGWPFLSGK
jgi:hypothetical protein